MVRQDIHLQIRRIWFGMPRDLEAWLVLNDVQSFNNWKSVQCICTSVVSQINVCSSGAWFQLFRLCLPPASHTVIGGIPGQLSHGPSSIFPLTVGVDQEPFLAGEVSTITLFWMEKGVCVYELRQLCVSWLVAGTSCSTDRALVTNSHHHFSLFCIFSKCLSFTHFCACNSSHQIWTVWSREVSGPLGKGIGIWFPSYWVFSIS